MQKRTCRRGGKTGGRRGGRKSYKTCKARRGGWQFGHHLSKTK